MLHAKEPLDPTANSIDIQFPRLDRRYIEILYHCESPRDRWLLTTHGANDDISLA